ncbi:AAA family ATPase [Dyella sp. Tek66A03]|uniref:AAA family ATPase n=1 Tax=Dyella sp. Tek66A03 TaxID=3458298 RepID=UPI00403EC1E7
MFTIKSIEIDGFWHRHSVRVGFNPEVNVIIGRNGTGKTTFMNILQGILSVDFDALEGNQFDSATIVLMNESGQKRTIKVTKHENLDRPYAHVEYRISGKKYAVIFSTADEPNRAYRRRANEQAAEVRSVLSGLLSLASLSVYRMRSDAPPDGRERPAGKRYISPVDVRLMELTQQLTHYQLELSQQAQEISINLQRQVLTTLLYEKEAHSHKISLAFNAQEEKSKLVAAYSQLGVTGSNISKRINEHVVSIEQAVKSLAAREEKVDFATFEAMRRTEKVVKLSLDASANTTVIYSQINLFLEQVRTFITDKKFSLIGGDLKIEAGSGPLSPERLSSGEKQLLILLIEALLQRQQPFVFLADEPELSLHIAWQRRIVPAVQKMNPNAQIIVATHSPEVAAGYKSSMIDMEDMIHGAA